MTTAQKAADSILRELKVPTSSKDLARLALERGLVRSYALKPIDSLAQTIEKNIRDQVYNKPKLKFVYGSSGRLIATDDWIEIAPRMTTTNMPNLKEVTVRLPAELVDEIQLATYARTSTSIDETFTVLLRLGLTSIAPQIKQALIARVNKLGST